jgi:GDP-L-fucose synthase
MKNINNNIVITGGNGLLGSKLIDITNGVKFDRSECDLITDNFKFFLDSKNIKPTTVFHCAAMVGGVIYNNNNNQKFFIDNIKIDDNVLSSCFDLNVKNIVTILSTCVFPSKVDYPLTSDMIDMGDPHNTNYGYSYAKRILAYKTKLFKKVTGNNWISVIPCNLYGTNDNFNIDKSHLIPALIRKAYEAKINDTDFVVWGDGSPLRQFMFSNDIAEIINWSVDNWKEDKPLMAVNEKEFSIKEIANIIADIIDIPKNKIKYDKTKPNGQFRKPAKSDVNWYDFTPIENGINDTIEWFIKNYDNTRK